MKRRRSTHRGISLIETIACVAIVATMATSIVGVMQNSVRVASASRGELGAPAQARQALRLLSDRMRRWDETDGITHARGSVVQAGPHRYSFRRVASATGSGHDLTLVDELGNETV